jgi:hypothetical protein
MRAENEGSAGQVDRDLGGGKMLAGEVHDLIRDWAGPGNLVLISHGHTVVAVG